MYTYEGGNLIFTRPLMIVLGLHMASQSLTFWILFVLKSSTRHHLWSASPVGGLVQIGQVIVYGAVHEMGRRNPFYNGKDPASFHFVV